MKDVISLIGMRFYGFHGVSAAERETGRAFEVDCALEVDLADAGQSDNLQDTVDYSRVYEAVKGVVEGKAFSLVESLAREIADLLLSEFEVYSVTVKVRKLHPPIVGNMKHIEIEIRRTQSDTAKLLDISDKEGADRDQ